jgi:hypothetical protein
METPDGFEDCESTIYTVTPGDYTLKVTNVENGCSTTVTVTAGSDYTQPESVIISPADSPVLRRM